MESKNKEVFDLSFESFFNLHLDLLCILDLEGKYLSVNNSFFTILGYKPEELHLQQSSDFIHPEDLLATADIARKLLSKKEEPTSKEKIFSYTNRILHKEGYYKYIQWRSYVKDSVVYSAARDITKNIEREQELAINKKRLEGMANLDGQYIFRVNSDFKFTYANEKYLTEHKEAYQVDDLVGEYCFKLHDEASTLSIKENFEKARTNIGQPVHREIKKTILGNKTNYILWELIAIADKENNDVEYLAMGVDVTEKRIRQEKIKAQKELQLLEMSTPITQLWDGILLLPIVGSMTEARVQILLNNTLNKIADTQAKVFIFDISGLTVIDTLAANYFIKLAKATKLMGCICTMSGISPAVAQTMISLGIEIEELNTTASLKDALESSLNKTNLQLVKIKNL